MNRLYLAMATVAWISMVSDRADAAGFEGSVTITPANPEPILIGSPGIDLLAEWTANKDLTKWEWTVDGASQGVTELTDSEKQGEQRSRNFQFVAAGSYLVCFRVGQLGDLHAVPGH